MSGHLSGDGHGSARLAVIEREAPSRHDQVSRDLRLRADAAGGELRVQDGRAWVVVVGRVDGARAAALASLLDDLAGRESLHRVSVDLTCATATSAAAAVTLDLVRLRSLPLVDVAAPGPLGRLLRRRKNQTARA
jgi:hypothetical protein